MEKSISFEGDSGPYLQYAYTRAKSILAKAKIEKIKSDIRKSSDIQKSLERFLYRFPEVFENAQNEYAPHHVLTYLTNLAQAFNSWYGNTKIVDPADPASAYKVALTEAFTIVLKNGLYILGIQAPEKM
jgi:arginyl-tRNA synthetase